MRNRVLSVALMSTAIVGLAACTAPEAAPGNSVSDTEDLPPLSPLSGDRDAPGLAMVAHLVESYFADAAREGGTVPTTCATLAPDPLSDAQEARLIARFPSLAPADRCVSGDDGGTVDSITGDPAQVIQAYEFACANNGESCRAWGSVPGAPSARFTMTWTGESWTFERDRRLLAE